MDKETFIFDIDGTLCNISASRKLHTLDKNWTRFHQESINEPPITSTVRILKLLKNDGHTIILCTAREGKHRHITKEWLHMHRIPYDELRMRAEGDMRRSYECKREHLIDLQDKGHIVAAAFDDREQDVLMWTEAGLDCYHIK